MDIQTIAELAKQGGRLDNDRQWVLADALAALDESDITKVSAASRRNESTLLQYARAAQRWDPVDRVKGVSFSAHRVALSWHDPRELLVHLKHKYGSPTVKQVRQAMGLEGHPAIELGWKMLAKLDDSVSRDAVTQLMSEMGQWLINNPSKNYTPEVVEDEPETVEVPEQVEVEKEVAATGTGSGTWKPPIRTDDVAGI